MKITRREGLFAAAAGALSATALLRARDALAQAPPIRKPIQSLSADELNLFRAAVSDMRANADYADPRSWMYWAWMHDYRLVDIKEGIQANRVSSVDAARLTGIPAQVLANTQFEPFPWPIKRASATRAWSLCPHHHSLFLPWHRAYLILFEEVLRTYARPHDAAAAVAMRLPYFDPFAANGVIPDSLALPKANGQDNALYHAGRVSVMDADELGIARDGLNVAAVSAKKPAENFEKFVSPLEGYAHDYVHDAMGGDMKDPRTAARDPIFWLHHANVDRQWVVLDSAGGKSPSTAAWSGAMPFITAAGVRTFKPIDMKSVAALPDALRYGYFDEINPVSGVTTTPPPLPAPSRPRNVLSAGAGVQMSGMGAGVMSLSRRRNLQLSGAPVALRFGIPAPVRNQVQSAIESVRSPQSTSAGSVTLVLEDVRALSPDASAVLIVASSNSPERPLFESVVGSISIWSLQTSAHGDHEHAAMGNDDGIALRVPIDESRANLLAGGSAIEVWLVPARGEAATTPAFSIGEARIEFSNAPVQ